ncbi:outer membrane beta-barrel protein [Stutzerimonas nitrititolerans]|uniref:outer membrane beta-barrel protein n=1 Tax=Stutzerimonas nitrititolerans TaxID=2482751 RepID=UPI0028A59685|nr:outer membrane beta-barrel protein [Stutzerimonas nitrititolerans]
MSNKIKASLLAIAVSAASGSALAVEAMSIKLAEGLEFTPSLKVSESYDDNFREVEDNEESSWVTRISPTLALTAYGRKSEYVLSYTADSDIFHSSHKDNNTDHHLTADAGFRFDARNALVVNAGYHKVEETTSATAGTQGDKYNTRNIGGVYTYGAQTAMFQVDFGADYKELRYDNTARRGNGDRLNSEKERDATALRSTLYYRVAPKTRALFEVRHTDYSYVSEKNLDATNLAFLTGLTWEATAKTTGTVKIGREKKSFDRNVNDDQSNGMWEAGITWQPRTYSTFNLRARRALDEGENGASAIEATSTTLDWKHYWLDRVYSTASYTRSEQDYVDDNINNRLDKTDIFGLGLNYEMRRWLDIGVGYKYAENDSNVRNESYERNIYSISITASL